MKRQAAYALWLMICGVAVTARATTLARMSVAEMTAAAQAVARVRCVADANRWEHGEIWAITTFEVLEVWKGPAAGLVTPHAQISVRLLGGHAGHLVSTVAGVPRFSPGEEAILFLEPTRAGDFSVTSWGQGTFRIVRERASGREFAVQDTAGGTLLDSSAPPGVVEHLRPQPLDQFREQVAVAADNAKKGSRP